MGNSQMSLFMVRKNFIVITSNFIFILISFFFLFSLKFLFDFLFLQILLPGILLHGSFDFSLFLVGAISFIYDDDSILTTVGTFVVAGGLTIGGIIYACRSFQKVKPTLINPLISLIPLPHFLSSVNPFVTIISYPLLKFYIRIWFIIISLRKFHFICMDPSIYISHQWVLLYFWFGWFQFDPIFICI